MPPAGILVRLLALVASAATAGYFWSTALAGNSVGDLLFGRSASSPKPPVEIETPAVPAPVVPPKPPRRSAGETPVLPSVGPVAAALADALHRGITIRIHAPGANPYSGLAATLAPTPVAETPAATAAPSTSESEPAPAPV